MTDSSILRYGDYSGVKRMFEVFDDLGLSDLTKRIVIDNDNVNTARTYYNPTTNTVDLTHADFKQVTNVIVSNLTTSVTLTVNINRDAEMHNDATANIYANANDSSQNVASQKRVVFVRVLFNPVVWDPSDPIDEAN